jgi:hypothetical protein
LAEGITCSISFNRHGTILAGETAVPVTSKTCCIVVLKPYYPLVRTGVTVRLSCHRSRLPGWQDCPVGFPDPECGADSRGAQVQSGINNRTVRSTHDWAPASTSSHCKEAALCAAARRSPGWSGRGMAAHSSRARSTVTSSGGTWSRAHRQGDRGLVDNTAMHSAAQLTRQHMSKPAKLTYSSRQSRLMHTDQLCDRWQTSTWGPWCRASAQTSTWITYAWRLICQGRRLRSTCKHA